MTINGDHTDSEPVTPDDKRLDRQLDYQKFHIGIYTSLSGAIIGGSAFFSKDLAHVTLPERAVLFLALLFLLFAGACAGLVAVRIPHAPNYDWFRNRAYGPRLPGLKAMLPPRLTAAQWEDIEHACFWIAMVLLGIFAFQLLRIARLFGG